MKNISKVALYSLVGPIIIFILRLPDMYQQINLLGINGVYDCAISFPRYCSMGEYLFTGDDAIVMYLGMLMSFVGLFLLIIYISFLARLYKNNNHRKVYRVLALTVFIIVALYCGIYYLGGEY